MQFHYDLNGNLTNLIYPGGRNVYYAYDALNHMTNVTDWASRKTSLTYDLAGRLTSITRPNGTQRIIGYDVADQTTNITEKAANGNIIAYYKLGWDNAARMATEFGAPLPHTSTVPTRSMAFDDDNRLTAIDGFTLANDTDGNMTSGPLTNDTLFTYIYDSRNRLLNVGGVTNAYDPTGNRIGQTFGTNSVAYVVNPNSKLSQVLMRIKNGVTNYYVYGAGLLYQMTESPAATNTLTYHYDYRGSTVALSDNNGNVTDRIEYSAFATTTYRAGTSDTPFLFNGLYGVMTDPNGLLNMRARYYNPFICRFINPDPSGFAGGLNFYAYANGNPVSYLDPFGLDAKALSQSMSWVPRPPLDESVGDAFNANIYNTLAELFKVPVDTVAMASYSVNGNPQDFTPWSQTYQNAFQESPDQVQANILMGTLVYEITLPIPGALGAVASRFSVAADTALPQFIYRTGSQTGNALTDAAGVSFRDSISSDATGAQVFQPGAKIYTVDTSQLPPGSVIFDGNPAGHVSVFASPAEIQSAIVPQGAANPLSDFGLKALEDGSSYRIPKN